MVLEGVVLDRSGLALYSSEGQVVTWAAYLSGRGKPIATQVRWDIEVVDLWEIHTGLTVANHFQQPHEALEKPRGEGGEVGSEATDGNGVRQ